jgi:peptidoglycan/LPS O-acetylase OafA/YrhL
MKRNQVLDAARGVASIIVLLNHFIFSEPFSGSTKNFFLYPLHTGALCVWFFFCLSGYVLTNGFNNQSKSRWICKRFLRLMPIYYVTYLAPLVLGKFLNYKGNSSTIGITLSLFASQSLTRRHYLDWPNPPLWSLSVEIYLSVLLLFFVELSKKTLMVVVVVTLLNYIFVSNTYPILCALPIFVLGMLLTDIKIELKLRHRVTAGIILGILYVVMSKFFYLRTGQDMLGITIAFAFILILMIYLLSFPPDSKIPAIFIFLGERSYVIYAAHSPIFFALNHFTHKFHHQPSLFWLLIYVSLTFIFVEFLYRSIETPAIKFAKNFMIRKSKNI